MKLRSHASSTARIAHAAHHLGKRARSIYDHWHTQKKQRHEHAKKHHVRTSKAGLFEGKDKTVFWGFLGFFVFLVFCFIGDTSVFLKNGRKQTVVSE